MTENSKAIKHEIRQKIKDIREKGEAFNAKGDFGMAGNCLFLARYLEDFLT